MCLPCLIQSVFIFLYSVRVSNSRFLFKPYAWEWYNIDLCSSPQVTQTLLWCLESACLSTQKEERSCLMLSTVLTLHKDSQNSVLLLSVHVIHKLSLCKSIKRCCQHEHQEIALMIDICLSYLWSVQAFYWQQSVWAGLHNTCQTTDFNFSGLRILACLGTVVGGRFLNDKMLYHIQLETL